MWLGRTGRIGHRGVATSFFTDRDEAIASVLTRTLLETNQDIPDFLQSYIPENYANGIKVKFETESDFDPNDVAGAGDAQGGGWGGDETANPDSGAGGGWGASGDSGDAANSGGGWGTGGDVAGGDSGGTWGAEPAPTKAW